MYIKNINPVLTIVFCLSRIDGHSRIFGRAALNGLKLNENVEIPACLTESVVKTNMIKL